MTIGTRTSSSFAFTCWRALLACTKTQEDATTQKKEKSTDTTNNDTSNITMSQTAVATIVTITITSKARATTRTTTRTTNRTTSRTTNSCDQGAEWTAREIVLVAAGKAGRR